MYALREYRAIQDPITQQYTLVLHTEVTRNGFQVTAWCNPSVTGCYVRLSRFTDAPLESTADGEDVQTVFVSDPFHFSAINKALDGVACAIPTRAIDVD